MAPRHPAPVQPGQQPREAAVPAASCHGPPGRPGRSYAGGRQAGPPAGTNQRRSRCPACSLMVTERRGSGLRPPRAGLSRPSALPRVATKRPVVLPYRRGMPARKRPNPEDAVTARRVLLDGLARDADIFELASEIAPLHPRDNTFPGEVFLQLAADPAVHALERARRRRIWRSHLDGGVAGGGVYCAVAKVPRAGVPSGSCQAADRNGCPAWSATAALAAGRRIL